MRYKLLKLLYKIGMDEFDWDNLIAELEKKSEKRMVVPVRVRESIYKEFVKACGAYKISDVVEILFVGFIRHSKKKKSKP